MRRIAAWGLLLFGAFIALAGIIDAAVGPEMQQMETGESSPRWYGLINIVIGVALAAWGHRLTKDPAAR